MDFVGETGLVGVQIAGSEPEEMAGAARFNAANGARIIDINMGCPAKKVCRRWAGSALLQDERLVEAILKAVVASVDVPVTLKIRTGWHRDHVNGVGIARIAEDAGISMLSVHGRTRDMLYNGAAEYDTIARIKDTVGIPVLANGDVNSPEKALAVLRQTSADGLMIGRGAQGRPWLFDQIRQFLETGRYEAPDYTTIREAMLRHVTEVHGFYGESAGVRIARKHLRWYFEQLPSIAKTERRSVLTENSADGQLELAGRYFDRCVSDTAVSMTSIQCRTGTSVPLARCS
jgi:tRNA-dihydrouridine synthase B